MQRLLMLVLIALVALGGCQPIQAPASTAPSAAAAVDPQQPLPVDPTVRTGTLDNGLTYYVRENHEPKQRAELWLAINAGSVLEDADQQGLAHFLEHMLFNGTERFPETKLVDFLETLGIQFGPDLNAYTSFDETVYQLQVPTDKPELLPQALDVLVDWAGHATIDPSQVDLERNVIVEEWRLRDQTAQGRINDKLAPTLLAGSRYAERLPIGDMDIVRNAPAETLRRFYETWYRPDLMAVIAVGDFDADTVVAQIEEKFATLQNPPAPAARPQIDVPVTRGDNYLVVSDPETRYAQMEILHRVDPQPYTVVGDLRASLVDSLIATMLSTRFFEISQQAGSPILAGGAGRGSLVRNADNYSVVAIAPEDRIQEGLDMAVTEVERARRHGFTASELARAKSDLLRQYQQRVDQRDTVPNAEFNSAYLGNYLNQEATPSIADEYALAQQALPTITLDMVNQETAVLMPAQDRLVILIAPEKEGLALPSEDDLKQTVDAATVREVAAYVDTVVDRPLLAERPEPAAIVAEQTLTGTGATELTLANGVRVILKQTDFDKAQVLITGSSDGGASLVADAGYPAVASATDVAGYSGVGEFTLTELQKLLTGKVASISPYIGELDEGFTGGAAPADLETALQLLYLYATQPRFDANGLQVYQDVMKTILTNRSLEPRAAIEDARALALCGESIRCTVLPLAAIEQLTLAQVEQAYRQRFADLGNATFVITGNYDPATIQDLVQRYLGNLPATGDDETWQDAIQEPAITRVEQDIYKGEGDRSVVQLVFRGPFEPSLQNEVRLSALELLLNIRLREVIREERGGSYSPYATTSSWEHPEAGYEVGVNFTTDPKRVAELLPVAYALVDELRTTPTSDVNLTKVKEQMVRSHELAVRDNGYWQDVLGRGADDPARLSDPTAFADAVDALTVADLQQTARQHLNTAGVLQIIEHPASAKP